MLFSQFTVLLAISSLTAGSDVGKSTLFEGNANSQLPEVPGNKACVHVPQSAHFNDFRSDFCHKVKDNKCQAPADGIIRLTQISFTTDYKFYPTDQTSFRINIISSDGTTTTTIFDKPIINGTISKAGTDYVVDNFSNLDPAAAGQKDSTVQMSIYDTKTKNVVACGQALFDAVSANS